MATTILIGSNGQLIDTKPVRDRIKQGREVRKANEIVWQSNMAFASGQQWLVADKNRTLRSIQQVDPRYRNRELYTADSIGEFRDIVLGELGSDDDRPQLLLQRDDQASEDYQGQVNRALGYAWDFEFDGDSALAEADRLCVDLGTSAIRCRFDPDVGKPIGQVPHLNGQPVFGEAAHELLAAGPNPAVQMQEIRSGRIVWEPLSAFNLIVPPGITHERYFSWECIVRPTLLAKVKADFGDAAADLKADNDIGSNLGNPTDSSGASYAAGESKKSALKDHVWLYTYYERSSSAYPKGRVMHFAGADVRPLDVQEGLPYVAPDGTYRSGIAYFHYKRVTGRFWSRALIESLKDGQRAKNKRRTQINEIIDGGLPYTLVQVGSQAKKRTDLPLEIIEIDRSENAPVHVDGVRVGDWWYRELEQLDEDMQKASGIRASSLGDNPSNVTTYSQLALMREADQVKRQPVIAERKQAIKALVEDSLYDMRTYWGPQKQIMLAGDDDQVEAEAFNASKIPDFFIVKVAKGAAKPRSQAAEIQKIQDLWMAALNSGAAPAKPQAWLDWLKESQDAGQVMDLPDDEADDQAEKAELENHKLLLGASLPVAYYDPPEVHIPIHRSAQIQAEQAEDIGAWTRIEQHVQMHLSIQKELAAQFQAVQAQQLAGAPASPPGSNGAPATPQGAPAPAGP